MIAAALNTHVRLDKSGVAWIDDTNVKVIEVIADHLAYGHSPDEVRLQHPHLSLAQIHSAFAHYFDHREELDAEMESRFRKIETLRAKAVQQPSRKKLLVRLSKS